VMGERQAASPLLLSSAAYRSVSERKAHFGERAVQSQLDLGEPGPKGLQTLQHQ
jgi:hypothetical protein